MIHLKNILKHQTKILKSGVLFLAIIFISLAGCKNDIDKIKTIITVNDTIQPVKAEGVKLEYFDSGKLKAIIEAPIMERFPEPKSILEMKKGLKGYFYNSAGKVENELYSQYGINYLDKKIIELKFNVILENDKGEKLNTEKLIWDQNSGKVFTDEFVKITTANEVIYGNGFEADQNFNSYRIFNITGILSVKDGTF